MQLEEDDGCLEKYPRQTHQVLIEDCLEVPSLLTATSFAIFSAHFQGIWEMEGHFSHNNMPFAASDSSWVLLTMIEGTR